MINNGHKTIGVFVSEVNSEYPGRLCRGISAEAKARGFNVVFFTNFSGYGQDSYDEGEKYIADVVNPDYLDGLILATDTMHYQKLTDRVYDKIITKAKCPTVSVRSYLPEAYNILIDDNTVLEDVIKHLIEKHKFKRLVFLAGPKGHEDSEKRLECFLKIMKEHNLAITEDSIFYGDFWKTKPYEAVEYFLAPGKQWPEAIICANDYMAMTVCNALNDRGIRVPEDITVTGYDDLQFASRYSPSLTTAGVPIEMLGSNAVEIIDRAITGLPVEKSTYLSTYTVYRESCGCCPSGVNRNSVGRYFIDRFDDMQGAYLSNSRMANSLLGANSLETICDKLDYHVYGITSFQRYLLCLCEDWVTIDRPEGFSKDMLFAYQTQHKSVPGEITRLPMTKFSLGEILPDGTAPKEATSFFVNVVHHQEKVFGYTLICFDVNTTYSNPYEGWMINLGNVVETVRTAIEMKRLVSELARTYTIDMLTGLYNRRGLEVLSKELLSAVHQPGDQLMIFCADMDDLKAVNDNFGHANGDIAIKAISDALKQSSVDDYICTRCGGDEFTVIGILRSDNNPTEYSNRVSERIDEFNRTSGLPWQLHVSFGWHVVPVEGLVDIEEGMSLADGQLYKRKAMNKARRLIEQQELN